MLVAKQTGFAKDLEQVFVVAVVVAWNQNLLSQ